MKTATPMPDLSHHPARAAGAAIVGGPADCDARPSDAPRRCRIHLCAATGEMGKVFPIAQSAISNRGGSTRKVSSQPITPVKTMTPSHTCGVHPMPAVRWSAAKYPAFSSALRERMTAEPLLMAVTSDYTGEHREAAYQQLNEAGIVSATLRDVPMIAARARLELGLRPM